MSSGPSASASQRKNICEFTTDASFNIDLFDPGWENGETGCVFAETILVTESGPRRLHSFPTGFQIIP